MIKKLFRFCNFVFVKHLLTFWVICHFDLGWNPSHNVGLGLKFWYLVSNPKKVGSRANNLRKLLKKQILPDSLTRTQLFTRYVYCFYKLFLVSAGFALYFIMVYVFCYACCCFVLVFFVYVCLHLAGFVLVLFFCM